MNLNEIINFVTNKNNFRQIQNYIDFALEYLEFIKDNLQAVIVAKNETNYRFFQYKEEGGYNVTRPINSEMMLSYEDLDKNSSLFLHILTNIRDDFCKKRKIRKFINNFIYTCQQCIGASLDALPSKRANTARKINGDLFERLIHLILQKIGVEVISSSVSIPIIVNGEVITEMNYQHDLVIGKGDTIKAIGSVKTSSKDRIDKIFIDKFLYNRLTESDIPHFAIFLNDVQRRGRWGKYSVNTTFLSGRFRGYTIKLTPLDGVYYFDIRPNMRTDRFLQKHIKTFDHFIITDIWEFCD